MGVDSASYDRQIRAYVYDAIFRQDTIPTADAIAASRDCLPGDVAAAFQRLAQDHVFVLQRDSHEILMANPFSAVPTPFQVEVERDVYWGNCVWDALGILAMLKRDGRKNDAPLSVGRARKQLVHALGTAARCAHLAAAGLGPGTQLV